MSIVVNWLQHVNQELQRLLAQTSEDTSVDHEEELREMLVAQAQSFARDALDELDMIAQVCCALLLVLLAYS